LILLDTNVLSALMQAAPERAVIDWLDRQAPEDIWTTSVSTFEVRFGLARLPAGRRRATLESSFQALIDNDLLGKVASFDRAAAEAAAILATRREAAGRPVDFRDAQIAGIAIARRATIATRNLRHFEDLDGLSINPWES
jgi:predicted nucleic acid-binding protein